MSETTVSALVEGGKASAGPPIGPALGPTGVNIGQVISEINQKTQDYKGIQVPVDIIINSADKSFKIKVGSPPVSALLKKELGVDKLHGGMDIPIDYVIKVARNKKDGMLANSDKAAVKEVLGTCQSMKITVEGLAPKELQKKVDEGVYDAKIEGKDELELLTKEELQKKKEEVKKLEAQQKKEAEEAAEEAPAEGEEKKEEPSGEEKKEEPAEKTEKEEKK